MPLVRQLLMMRVPLVRQGQPLVRLRETPLGKLPEPLWVVPVVLLEGTVPSSWCVCQVVRWKRVV
jgi:hypothetical protein